MSYEKITSRRNSLVKHARAVRDRREQQEQIFIEGLRLAEEALRSKLNIQDALYTEKFQESARGVRLLAELKAEGCRLSPVSEDVIRAVSDTKTPPGIVLLAARPHASTPSALDRLKGQAPEGRAQPSAAGSPLIVVIHGINNPANAGAILRTAEAAGANGVIATRATTDLFSTKALRGAMGSTFRLPLWAGVGFAEAIEWCRHKGMRTVGASLKAAQDYTETDWKKACALVVGSEASGLSELEASMLDETILIPMRPPVESLNVAVAAGVILYEAAKQRK